MKKIIGTAFAALFAAANLFAYNPPAGGQNILRLTGPQLLTDAGSAAGGGIFGASPASIINNPALTAWEQRTTLDLAGTLFVNGNSDYDSKALGGATQLGILIPTRWCVPSFLFQGLWTEFFDMPVESNISFTAGASKDITDYVSIGLNTNFGLVYGNTTDSDWSLSASLGAFYNYGDLFFMKDLRFGVSLNNLGKMYTGDKTIGILAAKDIRDNKTPSDDVTLWPGLCTLRTGVAATFFRTDIMNLGLSLDLSYPSFQDLVLDTGVQIQFWDFLKVSSAWELDVQEVANGAVNVIPSLGVSYKFIFNAKKDSYLARQGWEQSEITTSAAWRNLYQNINAFSAGAVMNLGMQDAKAPEVILWDGE